jgi:Flp pilus assembly protein TadD
MASECFRAAFGAYWQGDYATCLERLDLAASLNASDARVWYFKGFSEAGLGRTEDATASLARAVQCHAQNPRDPSILRALERIQGPLRSELQQAMLLVPVAAPQPRPHPPADQSLVAQAR